MPRDTHPSSDPVDQVALVLNALSNPKERAKMLFDPHAYASGKNVRLDSGFVTALRAEVDKINERLLDLEENFMISLPRVNDLRTSELPLFATKPGEVAILPAVVLAVLQFVVHSVTPATVAIKCYQIAAKVPAI